MSAISYRPLPGRFSRRRRAYAFTDGACASATSAGDASSRSGAQGGFALIVALMLMGFLILLLLSLTSTTQVQLQQVQHDVLARQARENALFALQIAQGELQRLAGADRRVTGTAALGQADTYQGANSTAHRTAQNGLRAATDGGRHWTGVWGNPQPSQNAYLETPSPVLLNWLVSGNEGVDFSAVADGTISEAPSYGSAAGSIRFAPDAVPQGDDADWVVLAGAGSVETAEDRVKAPLVAIDDNVQQRYAWWVGDEGVKARYNLSDTHDATGEAADPGASPTALAERYRLSLAQRSGIELVTGMAAYTDNLNAQGRSTLGSLLARTQIGMTLGASGVSAQKRRFHDVSLHSLGVLSDSLNGGLRQDLGYLLATGAKSGRIIPALSGSTEGALLVTALENPRWEHLNSFYQQVVDTIDKGYATTAVGDDATHHLTPVLVQARQLIRLRVVPPATATGNGRAYMGFAPLVVLANPYNVTLRSPGVEFRWHGEDSVGNSIGSNFPGSAAQMILTINGTMVSGGNRPRLFRWHDEGTRSLLGSVVFRTGSFEIEPGQSKVFSLAGNQVVSGGSVAVLQMQEGLDTLTPDYAADINIGNIAAENFNVNDEETLQWNLLLGGRSGHFSVSMYPLSAGTPAADPLATRPLQRVEKIGFGMGGTDDDYRYVFPAPQRDGPETYFYYLFRNDVLSMPARQRSRQRIYADYNIRSQLSRRPKVHASNNPMVFVQVNASSFGEGAGAVWMDDINPPKWGRSMATSAGVEKVVLFDMRHSGNKDVPLLSVGALRHANLTFTTDDIVHTALRGSGTEKLVIGEASGYSVGSGWANPYVAAGEVAKLRDGDVFYDTGYLLNTALFDPYFISTIPVGATDLDALVLPHSRLVPLRTDVGNWTRGRDEAAHLLLGGAFNVNSVSVEAWKALLGGMRFNDTGETVFARSLEQPEGASGNTGTTADAYAGLRKLSDDQVRELAEAIVSEVRQRGPFLSLAQFANRRLGAGALGNKGALQSALDRVSGSEAGRINDPQHFDPQNTLDSSDSTFYRNTAVVTGAQAAGVPGWLTQGDLLQALGPVLAARSDTFIIRTYGEVRNEQGTAVLARAWCEALVQRVPEPVNPSADNRNEPQSEPDSQGRRFRVIDFRWLDADEV